jgi:membrane protein YqaA with SNARE-associated domain
MQFLFAFFIISWTFLEASFWWVAPDIAIGIAYVYEPRYWLRYLLYGLFGACLGSIVTYLWASYLPDVWLQHVSKLPLHTAANISYVRSSLANPLAVIPGAWTGIPYKLYIGLAPEGFIPFWLLLLLGLISRLLRFSFTLFVTHLIRNFLKPWSLIYPARLSGILLSIWAAMILLFDLIINGWLLSN